MKKERDQLQRYIYICMKKKKKKHQREKGTERKRESALTFKDQCGCIKKKEEKKKVQLVENKV